MKNPGDWVRFSKSPGRSHISLLALLALRYPGKWVSGVLQQAQVTPESLQMSATFSVC